ncbi:MAG: ribonuclease R [Coriobacteriia bacterium]|nr:ribonuclease R [Coriobacteriia bacterium]
MRPEKAVLKALRDAHRALTAEEAAELVSRHGIEPPRTERVLRSLVTSGAVAVLPNGRYLALKERNLLVGRLSMHRRGFAFVSTPLGEVYVARRDTGGALHGDTVAVRLHTQRARERRSGEVVQVLERGVTHVVGRLERHGALGIVVPTDPRIRHEVFVDMARSELTARDNDVVVVRVMRYPTRRDAMQGIIEEVLGPADAPGVDVEIVIREHGLRTAFPPEVTAASEKLTIDVEAELQAGRPDLRDLFTVTIDPVDAKDFDDAISIERRDGGFRLWVHIADVSHYVLWDDPVDEEARVRATSVYLADRVLPMLPERISNDLCSLKPGEDRLAFTVEFECDARGAVGAYKLYPSVIRSDRRLDYDSVDGWLESGGFPDAETERLLLALRDLAARLHERRIERGGLDFETVEARVTLDADGRPTGVTLRRRTVATNMIEEAMIAANEVVARHMRDAGAPMVYRIHEDPDPEALDELAVVLKEFDYPIKDVHGASPQTFQRIVAFAHGRPEELLINSLLIRALERARYSALLESHFGLASEAYCHFTSPIRRYPDLLVHRLLKAQLAKALDKEPAASIAPELDWLAEHCSVMEREAESAEDDSQRVKLVELMSEHVGEVFDALITGVVSFGMFVQLDNTAEGLVHVKAMADDYYHLDAERFMLIGERNGAVYRLGQRVRVRLIDADVAEKRLDFELA